VSRDFEVGTNVSCEESTISPRTGLSFSICHPLLLVSCNDCMGVYYATMLTQALLQVPAIYSMHCFFPLPRLHSHSHALHSYLMADLIPVPMGFQSSSFPWSSLSC